MVCFAQTAVLKTTPTANYPNPTYFLDTEGITPLGLAAYNGDLEAVRQLVEKGVEVNERMLGVTALWLAAGGIPRHDYEIDYYERADAKTQSEHNKHLAALTRVLQFLIAHGADVNAAPPNGTTPLMIAVQNGNLDSAAALLEHGAHVNAHTDMGDTALSDAAYGGDPKLVRLLLEHGAKVNGYKDRDVNGETPLMRAIHLPWIVSLLLDHGASVNGIYKDTGESPLTRAAGMLNDKVVRALIAHGADPNKHDRGGGTALVMAAAQGGKSTVETLINTHADVNLRTSRGDTALEIALKRGRKDVAEVLRLAGARE
jgi:ankyrin repeat protein